MFKTKYQQYIILQMKWDRETISFRPNKHEWDSFLRFPWRDHSWNKTLASTRINNVCILIFSHSFWRINWDLSKIPWKIGGVATWHRLIACPVAICIIHQLLKLRIILLEPNRNPIVGLTKNRNQIRYKADYHSSALTALRLDVYSIRVWIFLCTHVPYTCHFAYRHRREISGFWLNMFLYSERKKRTNTILY